MGFGKSKKVLIEVDASEMSAAQVRLLKSINSMIAHVITTDEEGEFFESSAEVMRMCAALIKQSHFATDLQFNGIPYADQAIEYSMDILTENMTNAKVVQYDN
ncbi:hypothetical protein [Bacteriovorax sp. Seq25_V]|uniref:hypothetical protein n=1 Tax=Bacteriovorax sp. Seq25_V TaxID=1201288 RepID=UPI00038A1A5F|nr:hypothetical protein [Bacteriovorax sp. Seq25_V]EQC44743.1 hypothetical protein M900_0402 [Bacteriovorax sp. Seq25_V]